jgi:CRP-like cAMP-binding protein
MSSSLLAAVLDGRVVVLDAQRARVILLDPGTERIWRACTGSTIDEIASRVGQTSPGVMRALRDLDDVGLVTVDQSRWRQTTVAWI